MRSKAKWIVFGVFLLVAGALYFVTREPQPFPFLSKYPIVESVTVADHRFIVLKAKYEDIDRELKELAGHPILETEAGELDQRLAFFSLEDNYISLSENVARPNVDGLKGYVIYQSKTEIRKGFCAVAFTPPPSLFQRFLTWMKGFFGDKKPEQSVTFSERP